MKKQTFNLEINRNSVGLFTEFWVPKIDCASAWFEDSKVSVVDNSSVDRAFNTLFSEEV